MLVNNGERLAIFLSMQNRFDYMEFVTLCKAQNVAPLSWIEYAQKAETVIQAINKYPSLEPSEAYIKFVHDNNGLIKPTVNTDGNCGSCGGGKVR